MMNNSQKKIFLYMALALVTLILVEKWNAFKLSQHPSTQTINKVTNKNETRLIKTEIDDTINLPQVSKVLYLANNKLSVGINEKSGEIVNAELLKFNASIQNKQPIQLYNLNQNNFYFAESGLVDQEKKIIPLNYITKKVTPKEIILESQDNMMPMITKRIQLDDDSYLVKVSYEVKSEAPWEGSFYHQVTRKLETKNNASFFHGLSTYEGTAISNPAGKHYRKISYKDLKNRSFSETISGGWFAIQQHYFLSAWLLDSHVPYHYYGHYLGNDTYSIGAMSQKIILRKNDSKHYSAKIYIGPEILEELRAAAPSLDLTVDFGWLWWFAQPILYLLIFLNKFIGNWGWSVIAVTFVIKLIFYRLSAKSYYSMANMRKLQPKLEELKKRYQDDKEKFGRATMELYQKEKVNPFSGCLPMLVQIPVFISLYYVLLESVQLRHADFILWIHDLSVPDPYFILPILMGAIMFLQQKMSPPPPDPTQAKMMLIFPLFFMLIGLNFSAGLALYMLTNSILSITQQWYITRSYERKNK